MYPVAEAKGLVSGAAKANPLASETIGGMTSALRADVVARGGGPFESLLEGRVLLFCRAQVCLCDECHYMNIMAWRRYNVKLLLPMAKAGGVVT